MRHVYSMVKAKCHDMMTWLLTANVMRTCHDLWSDDVIVSEFTFEVGQMKSTTVNRI